MKNNTTGGLRMINNRFHEEQIISILKEQQAGLSLANICRKYGCGQSLLEDWKLKYCARLGEESNQLHINPQTPQSQQQLQPIPHSKP